MDDIVAYHEAGHAFAAVVAGATVVSVTIDPEADDGPGRYGDTQVAWDHSQYSERELHRKLVLVALAGPVVEMIYTDAPFHPGTVSAWAADWAEATRAALPLAGDDRLRTRMLEQATIEVHRLFSNDTVWSFVAAIVDELMAHETLEGESVHEIVSQWMRLHQR